jgi:hypothetical protein
MRGGRFSIYYYIPSCFSLGPRVQRSVTDADLPAGFERRWMPGSELAVSITTLFEYNKHQQAFNAEEARREN